VVFLLGDGGTATLVEASERSTDPIVIELMTDGGRFDKLFVPTGGFRKPSTELTRQVKQQPDGGMRAEDHLYMDGMQIFHFSSTDVVKSIKTFMESENLSLEKIDFLVLHQANKFMTDKIARKLKFSLDKVPYSLAVYGNTGSASIPLTIAYNHGEMMPAGENRCLFCGFGVGLSWGIVDIVLNKIYCPPIVEI
jgi:3-oxoacyl-[acyl-carrier-protein] synthase-3